MKSIRCLLCPAIALALVLFAGGCESLDLKDKVLDAFNHKGELSLETITSGLKEALLKGTDNSVNQLSAEGGYGNNDLLRIPLPEELDKVAGALDKIGLGRYVEALEDKMNTGAERAAAQAKPVFWNAIKQMSFEDAKGILAGGDTAATDYLHTTTGDELRDLYAPIIGEQLDSVGAVRAYNDMVKRYTAMPFTKEPSLSLENYAADKALDGLFFVIGEEEQKIRQNPAARTSELLRKVFSSQTAN